MKKTSNNTKNIESSDDNSDQRNQLSEYDLMTLFYLSMNYLDYKIKFLKGKIKNENRNKSHKEMELLLMGLQSSHKINCVRLKCYCKLKQISDFRGEPMDTCDDKFSIFETEKNIKSVVRYLEQQLEDYLNTNPNSKNGIDFIYLKFLISFTGKITKASQI